MTCVILKYHIDHNRSLIRVMLETENYNRFGPEKVLNSSDLHYHIVYSIPRNHMHKYANAERHTIKNQKPNECKNSFSKRWIFQHQIFYF
jgi:hypothetical protein